MKRHDGRLQLTPTDLTDHLRCRHLTTLELARMSGAAKPRTGEGAWHALIRRKGDEHERRYLARVAAGGLPITTIAADDDQAAAAATIAAMRAGDPLIAQATFAADGWVGRADCLERVDDTTALGPWGYEAVDVKLARGDAQPLHVLQLGMYSEWIAAIQGVAPRCLHIEGGDGARTTIAVADIDAYVRRAMARFRVQVEDPRPTEPMPCAHCDLCHARGACAQWWTQVDHLSQVAGLTRAHVTTLRQAGITTMTQLAELDETARVPGLGETALTTLALQARLQVIARRQTTLPVQSRALSDGRGFNRLPHPDAGDIFLDLEGDPLWEPGRELWFLFGYLVADEDGIWRYHAKWAHDPDQELAAFEALVDLITARRATHPQMHVYHYSHAEPSALRRLAGRPSAREAGVDDLLRGQVFVDLYAIVRQALVIGAPSYGLKTVEALAGFTRATPLAGGSDAVVTYEAWRHDRDPGHLADIARYNEEDCLATLAVRDWLIAARPAGAEWWSIRQPEPVPDPEPDSLADERDALRQALIDDPSPAAKLVGEALNYHRREARPEWWNFFARLEQQPDELLEDRAALAGLTPSDKPPLPVARSLEYELIFPPQPTNLGHAPRDHATQASVNVTHVDDAAGVVRIRRGAGRAHEPLPTALIPGGPTPANAQQSALARLGRAIHERDPRYRAADQLLRAASPRVQGRVPGTVVQTTILAEQLALARELAGGVLPVQGPPGTGKTWLAARMIVELISHGRRVGVTAVSHKAINNLLAQVDRAALERGVSFRGIRKTGDGDSTFDGSPNIINSSRNEDCEDEKWDLVAGTAWLFAREGMDQRLDTLVIDEAGQMSLADALAVSTSAGNLIVFGDPQQLPHVTQADHPPGLGVSVMQHILRGRPTLAPAQGLFLTTTWRMHPAIGGFISQTFYEGRLGSHPRCAAQTTAAGAGIRFMPVDHAGCSSSSPQEAQAIAARIAALLNREWTGPDGQVGLLTEADIMVVTPYNAQVRTLRAALGANVRVGTVDKFQGQEAPVVFFSMASSSGDDLPRDVGFLFSRNRLNVAISRAQCLAHLVMSPALLDALATTVDDMRLIATLCQLVEHTESDPQ